MKNLKDLNKGAATGGGRSAPRAIFKPVVPTDNLGNDPSQTVPQGNAAQKPVASPQGGSYFGSIFVTLTTPTPNATIRYSLDGTNVTLASDLYTGPVPVAYSQTLRARAFRPDLVTSGDITEHYTISVTGNFFAIEDGGHFILEDNVSRLLLEAA
jgi:hypothetical protein